MTTRRGYRLLCPIARALDRVGDRWTPLILRDLHAGPATFTELQSGLGLASNLLSSRLQDLQSDGLVERDGERGPYRLTEVGLATRGLITALRDFGRHFDEPEESKAPGNLRTVYLPLVDIFEASPRRPKVRATLDVDGELFGLRLDPAVVEVVYGEAMDAPDTVITTTYRNLMDLAGGLVTLDEHLDRFEISHGEQAGRQVLEAYRTGLPIALG